MTNARQAIALWSYAFALLWGASWVHDTYIGINHWMSAPYALTIGAITFALIIAGFFKAGAFIDDDDSE